MNLTELANYDRYIRTYNYDGYQVHKYHTYMAEGALHNCRRKGYSVAWAVTTDSDTVLVDSIDTRRLAKFAGEEIVAGRLVVEDPNDNWYMQDEVIDHAYKLQTDLCVQRNAEQRKFEPDQAKIKAVQSQIEALNIYTD